MMTAAQFVVVDRSCPLIQNYRENSSSWRTRSALSLLGRYLLLLLLLLFLLLSSCLIDETQSMLVKKMTILTSRSYTWILMSFIVYGLIIDSGSQADEMLR